MSRAVIFACARIRGRYHGEGAALTELEYLKGRWRSLNSEFRQQALANAFGTFVGGLGLAVLLGLAAASARYVSTRWLMLSTGIAVLVWIFTIGSDAKNTFTAGLSVLLLGVSGTVAFVSPIALLARVALWR